MSPPVALPSQPLGKNGPLVPRIGVGLMNISLFNEHQTAAEKLALMDSAWSAGEVFWDTGTSIALASLHLCIQSTSLTPAAADEYGDSEELIGKWLAANPDKRDDVFICTKFAMRGHTMDDTGNIALKVDSSPEYCKQAIERSLKRLGVPYVDLYYCHRLDKLTPIETTVQAMVELKAAGKIKHLGLSECSAESLRRACAVHPITAVQVEYGPGCLAIESPEIRLLETCRELGVAVVCYSPLGHGLLGGGIRSFADVSQGNDPRGKFVPALQVGNIDKNIAVVDQLAELAKTKSMTVGQLCLGWLLAQGKDVFPIPGTTKVSRLQENVGTMDFEITAAEEQKVREIVKGLFAPRLHAATGFAFADTPPL